MSAAAPLPPAVVQGRSVSWPVVVRDAAAANATFVVDGHAVRRLIPEALEPLEPWPGRALLSLGVIDYRDNDLGDYDEISVAFFVRERGRRRGLPVLGALRDLARGDVATWIHRLPVNQSFTCEAGRRLWGFPKTVDDIRIEHRGDRVHCQWRCEGRDVLQVAMPRGGRRPLPDRRMQTWTRLGGVLHTTDFTSGAEEASFRPGGVTLSLGTHPIADELRALGLPRRALFSVWMGHMHGRFEPPVPC